MNILDTMAKKINCSGGKMGKTKYPILKEFFPFNKFAPPMSRRFVLMAQKHMKTPRFLWKDKGINVQSRMIPGYQGEMMEIIMLTPQGLGDPAPCLVYIHGGGFVFEGSASHFRLAMAYAKMARCKVLYVRYHLAPRYPFPVPQEDCYAALEWVYDHARELEIDRNRIGITGDSAGGTLAVTSCLMARDRGACVQPLFQLLVYPWLDGRNISESYQRFPDTPMWNSTLSQKVGPLINPDPASTPLAYQSPVEAPSHALLPPAYVEVAEFDCLHDDGVLYAKLLQEAGGNAELYEVKGAMHGFDTVFHAPTTQAMIGQRAAYMRKMFGHE